MLESVKIVHDRLTGGEYRFLSDFFRFIGIYVFDCIMEENQVPTDYSAVVIINKNILEKDLTNLKSNYPNAIVLETNLLKNKKDCLEWLIRELMKRDVNDRKVDMERNQEDLLSAASIYLNHGLMEERNSYAYLYTNRRLVERAKSVFLNAYEDTMEYFEQKDNQVSRYFFFFQMELIRCVNEACWFLNDRNFFDTKAVLNYIRNNMAKYFSFSNFNVLMGMLCETDIQYRIDAGKYYKIALESVKSKAYGSFCYYRLGRYYEKIEKNWENAIKYYREANLLNGKAYRVLYKIAMYYEHEKKDPQRALDYYRRICEILKEKEQMNYLQEKEYEYLYKTFFRMAEILREARRYSEAIEYYQKIIELNKKLDLPNQLYEEIYGADAKERQDATKKRLGLSKVYERLINVYKNTGNEDKISWIMLQIESLEEERKIKE